MESLTQNYKILYYNMKLLQNSKKSILKRELQKYFQLKTIKIGEIPKFTEVIKTI